MSTLFITVGSTKFDALVNKILDNLQTIKSAGFKRLIIQAGQSQYDLKNVISIKGFETDIYKYKNSIAADIEAADLVVGHAGAGTCLEVLRLEKRLLVVINETLMDNHQSELAEELAKENYVMQTRVENFLESLSEVMHREFKKFPSQKESQFEKIFDKALNDV